MTDHDGAMTELKPCPFCGGNGWPKWANDGRDTDLEPAWSDADTVPHEYRPLFFLPTIRMPWCVICGRTHPLNQHHAVFRSAGECYDPDTGKPRDKPTITLCGSGNTSGCHGLAHHRMLHFRNAYGEWEYLITDEPTKYHIALGMDGWVRVGGDRKRSMRLYAERGVSEIPY